MTTTMTTQSIADLLTVLGPVLATLKDTASKVTTVTKTKRRRDTSLRSIRDGDRVPLKPRKHLQQTSIVEEYDPEHPSYDDSGTTTMVVVKHTDMVVKCERYWKKRLKQRNAKHKAELKKMERSFESKIRSLEAIHRRSKSK
jgi:hypothetical protein